MSDKLIGPKVKIVLSKFLPAIFMDAMRDSAEASVHMFEGELFCHASFMLSLFLVVVCIGNHMISTAVWNK